MSPFLHLHAAHCESGVTAALLRHAGLELSEPLAFGLGSGLFFCFPPFVRVMGMPLVSFRSYPGTVFQLACRRLGVQTEQRKYASEARGIEELDQLLARGVAVGVQTNMFWLSYFPREFRSQFNGHNLIALARRGDVYELSDPMLKEPVELDADLLRRSRFSKGLLAPRGALYFPLRIPAKVDLGAAVVAAVRDNARKMLAPFPIIGVRGIRRLARHVRAWARREDEKRQRLLLGHVVRMQEEVGTGGAGFRFMYAAFLQAAGELLGHAPYLEASERMTAAGDAWRAGFAGTAARIMKGHPRPGEDVESAAELLLDCARREEELFRFLLANTPRTASVPVAHALASR